MELTFDEISKALEDSTQPKVLVKTPEKEVQFTPVKFRPCLPDPNPVIFTYFSKPLDFDKELRLYHTKILNSAFPLGATKTALLALSKELLKAYPNEPRLSQRFKPTKEHYAAYNKSLQHKVHESNKDIIQVSVDDILGVLSTANRLLNHPNTASQILGVMFLTGRRPVESVVSKFEISDGNCLNVSNLAKKKGEGVNQTYRIYSFCNPEEIIRVTNSMYNPDTDPVKFNQVTGRNMNTEFKKYFKEFKFLGAPYHLRALYAEWFIYQNKQQNNRLLHLLTGSNKIWSDSAIRGLVLSHDSMEVQAAYTRFVIN
jgi:hypothetical protein